MNRFDKWSTTELNLLYSELKNKKNLTEEETYLLEEAIKELQKREILNEKGEYKINE